jgi:hypothetical protein
MAERNYTLPVACDKAGGTTPCSVETIFALSIHDTRQLFANEARCRYVRKRPSDFSRVSRLFRCPVRVCQYTLPAPHRVALDVTPSSDYRKCRIPRGWL